MPSRVGRMGRVQLPGSEGKALLHEDIGRQTRTTTMHREQNDECTLGILHDSVAPAWDLGSPDLTAIILNSGPMLLRNASSSGFWDGSSHRCKSASSPRACRSHPFPPRSNGS